MDDYFQILIYLIIIFAFLNSLFKKRDKKDTPKRPSDYSPPQERNTYSSENEENRKQDEYDILNEIEGLFRGEKSFPSDERKTESDIEKAEMRKVPVEEHTEDREWHTEDKEWHSEDKEWHSESDEWHQESTTEHELDQSWHTMNQNRRIPKIDKTIEKEAEKFEQLLTNLHEEEKFNFEGLRKKLYSPQSLKEFIIYSEILGKPKYLRR